MLRRRSFIRAVSALVLAFTLVIMPAFPLFADEEENTQGLSTEELTNEGLNYRIIITGPDQIVIPTSQETSIIQKYTAKAQYNLLGLWINSSLNTHIEVSAFTIEGVSWNNGQDELTVNPMAATGNVNLSVWIQPVLQPKVFANLDVAIVRAPSTATRIDLSGPEDLYVPHDQYPNENNPVDYQYTATVYDQYGAAMDVETTIWAEGHQNKNIEFNNGIATLHNISLPVDFMVYASIAGVEATDNNELNDSIEVHVHKDMAYPARMMLNGASSINIPTGATNVTETYTATVFDQYGIEMVDEDVTIFADNPLGTSFIGQTGTLTVTKDADHTYFSVHALLGSFEASEIQMAMQQMHTSKTVYLLKTAAVDIDDVNNLVLGANERMQYRVNGGLLIGTAGSDSGWRNVYLDEMPKFNGNLNVAFRYSEFAQDLMEDAVLPQTPIQEGIYGPEFEVNFTVLPPTINAPASAVRNADVSLVNEEDPNGEEEYITKQMFYRLNGASEWTLYEGLFNITQTSTVEAKTVVTIQHMFPVDTEMPYENEVHESVIVSKTIEITIPARPPREPQEEPVAVVTEAPAVVIEAPVVPLGALEEPAPVPNPLGDFAYLDALEDAFYEEQAVPQGALNEDVAITDTVVPLGDATLPQTGELPMQVLYGLGGLISMLGVYLRRK